jgi:uncharacterized protein (TIGR01370 family)
MARSLSITLLAFVALLFGQAWGQPGPGIAFYYADHVSTHLLAQFDQVVVEPEHVDSPALRELREYGAEVFAYVSVGEAERWRSWHGDLAHDWFLGENPAWHTDVMDLAKAGWRSFLLHKRIETLWQQGYRAFFLDTLDSYQRVVSDPKQIESQETGLVVLIQQITAAHPQAKLLVNRGFPVLPRIAGLVNGLVAESLFASWDPAHHRYVPVSESDRAWLLQQLRAARDQYNLPVIVVDYLPPQRRDEARTVARKVADLGFVPWVTTPQHDYLGIGSLETLPRQVLMLYDGRGEPEGGIAFTEVHTMAAVPLEHLGYVPVYVGVSKGLPDFTLRGRYAGVVSWFQSDIGHPKYVDWLEARLQEGTPCGHAGRPWNRTERQYTRQARSAGRTRQP